MGQAASREAAKQAKKLVGDPSKLTLPSSAASAAAPRPPPLGRPMANAPEHTEDAIKALSERQQKETRELMRPGGGVVSPRQAPQPDLNSGFFRGQITDPRDVAQEKFLVHQSGAPKPQQTPELAPDLLKFLQDVGPLEKRINKEMTSPRIVKELEGKGKAGEESEKMHRFEAARRTRNDMRLVDDIEGFSTPRTTNFFTSSLIEDEADFGLTDLQMYAFLKRAKDQDPKLFCSSFHQEILKSNAATWTDEEKGEQEKLLKDVMKYVSLPVIVKDDDASFIGMPQKELDKEFAHQKLDVVSESRVKLVLADLHDLGKKEIKRIR